MRKTWSLVLATYILIVVSPVCSPGLSRLISDSTGPKVKFDESQPRSTLNNPRFSWTADEPANFQCALDDPTYWEQCGGGTNSDWQGRNIPDGEHTLYVRGKDDLGNIGKPTKHQFTVGKFTLRLFSKHFSLVKGYCQ